MSRPQIKFIQTRSIDTASYIMAATGQDCSITFAGGSIASFQFESNILTRDALVSFECGGEVEGKKLLENRSQLFKRIKGGAR